jgi:hypothetical protein
MHLLMRDRYFRSGYSMVTISVGQHGDMWTLPEDFICGKIDYFRRAFKGGFKEADEKKILLVDDDPKAFGALVNWLFGALCIYQGFEEKVDEAHILGANFTLWPRSWVLNHWKTK